MADRSPWDAALQTAARMEDDDSYAPAYSTADINRALNPMAGVGSRLGTKWTTPTEDEAARSRFLDAKHKPTLVGKFLGTLGLDASGERARTSWGDAALSSLHMPYRFGEAAWDALNAPADVLRGRIPMGYDAYSEDTAPPPAYTSQVDPTVLGRGLNFAGTIASASPVAPRPTNAAGMFGGPLAKTADRMALAKAERMEKDGFSRNDIRLDTGWLRDASGNWRFEFSDQGSKQLDGKSATLAGHLEHPTLYENYPQLSGLDVRKVPSGATDIAANYLPRYDGIRGILAKMFGSETEPSIGVNARTNVSSLLHEGQHAIDDVEGAFRGLNKYAPYEKTGYANAPFEKMARAVQTRADMTDVERANRAPWLDWEGKGAPRPVATEASSPTRHVPSYDGKDRLSIGLGHNSIPGEGPRLTPQDIDAMTNAAYWRMHNASGDQLNDWINNAVSGGFQDKRAFRELTKALDAANATPEQRSSALDFFMKDQEKMRSEQPALPALSVINKAKSIHDEWVSSGRPYERYKDENDPYRVIGETYDRGGLRGLSDAKKTAHVIELLKRDDAEFGNRTDVYKKALNMLSANSREASLPGTVIRSASDDPVSKALGVARQLDPLGYYSQALEVARGLSQAKGTPEQMLAQLRNAGVKQAEIEATGLDTLLAQRSGDLANGKSGTSGNFNQITGDEIVKHLEGNRVGLKEVVRGDNDGFLGAQRQPLDEAFGGSKWSNYSLDPSNPTYRETVIHLPAGEKEVKLQDLYRKIDAEEITYEEFNAARNRLLGVDAASQIGPEHDTFFRSGHFPEPNIVGHMQTSMNHLPLADEARLGRGTATSAERLFRPNVYTIDQIQSDWGQKLRDGGVRDEAKVAELKQKLSDETRRFLDAVRVRFPDEDPLYVSKFKLEKVGISDAEVERLGAELRTAEASTPGHPLVNTTDQWTNTTLRRAIRQAAEADASYIAIPSGDTVLSYNPGDTEGMRGFYDKIVPKNLRNLLTKMDPSIKPEHIQTLDSPSGKTGLGKGFTIFPLTDKVKQSVMGGQPLFSNATASSLPGTMIRDKDSRDAIDRALGIANRYED